MLSTRFVRVLVLLNFLLIVPSFAVATPIVFSDFGFDTASILDGVNAFRSAIGGVNNGNAAGPFTTGRREINWDGGGAAAPVLTNMPKDLFQNNRGAFFGPATTTFSISGAPDPRFGNINPSYTSTFKTFSEPRLFAPTNSIVTEQTFTVPGSKIPATTLRLERSLRMWNWRIPHRSSTSAQVTRSEPFLLNPLRGACPSSASHSTKGN